VRQVWLAAGTSFEPIFEYMGEAPQNALLSVNWKSIFVRELISCQNSSCYGLQDENFVLLCNSCISREAKYRGAFDDCEIHRVMACNRLQRERVGQLCKLIPNTQTALTSLGRDTKCEALSYDFLDRLGNGKSRSIADARIQALLAELLL